MHRVGILSSGPPIAPDHELFVAMRDVLRENGYVEGENIAFEYRFSDGSFERLPELARELVRLDIDVIVAHTTAPTQAALSVTKTVPIVMASSHDPVAAGVVASLARPGGNVTGQSLTGGELMPKQLEVLKELVPSLSRVAYLSPVAPPAGPGFPSVTDVFLHGMESAAAAGRLQLQVLNIRSAVDLDGAATAIEQERPGALFLIESPFWGTRSGDQTLLARVVGIAAQHRLPSMSGLRVYAERGLLTSYGNATSNADVWRGAARFVAKILNGARPADLPVEQPTKLELVLNLKTAQAIGITFPSALLARADHVIR